MTMAKIPEKRRIQTLPSALQIYGAALMTARKQPTATVSSSLPELCLDRPSVALDAAHITRYSEVCGFTPAHGIPLTYPHMLAFPLHMLFMADRAFPYSMMGLIHLANSIRQHARLTPGQVVSVEVRSGEQLAHEKGQVFTLLTEISLDRELVWESTSTYLRTGISNPQGAAYASRLREPNATQAAQTWALDGGLGRRYGRVSRDINPIHLYRPTAMMFGFRRAIAHGMWTKARALAALMPARPVDNAETAVEFKTPLYLPGKATLWADPYFKGQEQAFEVKDSNGEKPHLRGVWRG